MVKERKDGSLAPRPTLRNVSDGGRFSGTGPVMVGRGKGVEEEGGGGGGGVTPRPQLSVVECREEG